MAYGILATGWIIYFFLHSLLAADQVKNYTYRFISPQAFRLIYSVFATLGLAGLLVLAALITPRYWIIPNTGLRYVALMLATFGLFVIRLAFRQYPLKSFLGFTPDAGTFSTGGILRFVRHPLYSGTILIVLGYLLFVPTYSSLLTAGCIFLYLPVGIWLEERKLIRHFGDAYRHYRDEVPPVIPRWPWR
jgi:protein-S-isoprenylcysteine O-methyltransferase Ste14